MAVLTDRIGDEGGQLAFTLTPVPPTRDGLAHGYDVAFQVARKRFERRYHVEDWQLGHWLMYCLAGAFIQVADVPPQQLTPQSITASGRPEIASQVGVFVDHYWLRVCLTPDEYLGERYVAVNLWLKKNWLDEVDGSDFDYHEWVSHEMTVTPQECGRFGKALVEECLAAALARVNMGLGIPDDYTYLGLPEPEETEAERVAWEARVAQWEKESRDEPWA